MENQFQLKWKNPSGLEELHYASLEILQKIGMRIDNKEALMLLKDAGCIVKDNNHVKFPAWLVEECIRLNPSRIRIANQKGETAMELQKNSPYFGTGSDLPYIIDMEDEKRRYAKKSDVESAAMLLDILTNYDFAMSYVIATDTPSQVSDLYQFEAMVCNTIKPIIFTAHDEENTEKIIEMAATAVGGSDELRENPFIILYSEPISPLVHTDIGIGKMFKCIEYGIPVVYVPGVVAGGTTSITKAGTIVQMNAEALAGIVMAQLKEKGAQIIIGGGATPMDMKTTTTLYGSPETQMNYAIMTELSQYYGIPNFTEAGCTNAPVVDSQAGMEAGIGILMSQLSGANLIHDVGYLEGGKTGYLPFLTICDDFISAARYISRGTKIDKNTMSVKTVEEVGIGGNFIDHFHTFNHFKQEIWQPRLFNRMFWEQWEKKGKKTFIDVAKEETKNLLKGYKNQIDIKKVEEIKEMVKKATKAKVK
jgi:trimethylamine--corrinoid protein Co-methyltransferase